MRFNTHLKIYLDRLSHNFEKLYKLAPQNEILFMIKADAYGHGLAPIVRFASENKLCKEFGCASIGEAIKLREEIPEEKFEIYVFSDLEFALPQCLQSYSSQRIMPVISNKNDLLFFLQNKEFETVPLNLKFNTGMNRLGFLPFDVEWIIDNLKKRGRTSIYHILSHLSASSSKIIEEDLNNTQKKKFDQIILDFKSANIKIERTSLSNTGAILQNFGKEYSHIRPGLMLYGPTSLDSEIRKNSPWFGKTISDLETHVIGTQKVKKNDPVGYGPLYAKEDGHLVIVSMGYGDGLSTHYKNLKIRIGTFEGKLCGRINMDMSAFLFPVEASQKIKQGDYCKIWGENTEDVLQISTDNQTIAYELFCQVSGRIPRLYCLK